MRLCPGAPGAFGPRGPGPGEHSGGCRRASDAAVRERHPYSRLRWWGQARPWREQLLVSRVLENEGPGSLVCTGLAGLQAVLGPACSEKLRPPRSSGSLMPKWCGTRLSRIFCLAASPARQAQVQSLVGPTAASTLLS